MKKRFTLFLLLFIVFSTVYAQNRANNILFNREYNLHFERADLDPKIEKRFYDSSHISFCISNKKGELALFSTYKGLLTRTRNKIIQLDDYSYWYSTVILPYENSDSLYHVLYHRNDTIFRIVVDAEYDNANGRVIQRDTVPEILTNYNWGGVSYAKANNPNDYWIFYRVRDSTIKVRYLNKNGLQKANDSMKITHQLFSGYWYNNWIHVAPDRKHIYIFDDQYSYNKDTFMLSAIEFDPLIGKFKSLKTYKMDFMLTNPMGMWTRSSQLSPNGKLLYASIVYSRNFKTSAGKDSLVQYYELYQYDISDPDNGISAKLLHTTNNRVNGYYGFYDMVLAPNKKIYLTYSNAYKIGVINYPDKIGVDCKLDTAKYTLTNNYYSYYFPNIYMDNILTLSLPDTLNYCEGSNIDIVPNLYSTTAPDSINWRGKFPYPSNTEHLVINNAQTWMSSKYEVSVYYSNVVERDTVYISINPNPTFTVDILPTNKPQIGDEVTLRVNSTMSNLSYLWNTGETTQEIKTKKAGTYKVIVTTDKGCSKEFYLAVKFYDTFQITFDGDSVLCDGAKGSLYVTNNDNLNWEWSDGSVGKSIIIDKAGKYWVKVNKNGKYYYSDTINVKISEKPKISILAKQGTKLCTGGYIDLIVKSQNPVKSYVWSNGSKKDSIRISSIGTYIVEATNYDGCSTIDSIIISQGEKPPVNILASANSICSGDIINLESEFTDPTYSYTWTENNIDFSSSSKVNINKPGVYYLTIKNATGCQATDTIEIANGTNLNAGIQVIGKTVLCDGETTILKALPFDAKNKYKWSNGASSPDITVDKDGVYSVEVIDEFGCKGVADTSIYKSIPYPVDNVSISFDEVEIGNNSKKSLILSNPNDIDYRISSISINPPFALDNVSFPLILKAKKELSIPFIFTPANIDESQSTGKISIDLPCSQELNLKANGFGYIFVDLIADTITALIGDTKVPIAINAKYNKDIPSVSGQTSIKAKIKYNNLLYGVNSSSNFDKFTNNLEQSYTDIEDNLTVQGKTSVELGRLLGNIYLAEAKYTDIQLENLSSSNKYIRLTSQDGKVSTYAICGEDIRKIKLFKQTELIVNSVNTGDIKYSFYTEDKGDVELELRDINGSLISKLNYTNSDRLEISSAIPSNEIGSGVYLISLNTRWGKIVKKISLIK